MSGTDSWPGADRYDSAGGWNGGDGETARNGGFGDGFEDGPYAGEERAERGAEPDSDDFGPDADEPDDDNRYDDDRYDEGRYDERRGRFAAARGSRFGADRGTGGRFGALGARRAAPRGSDEPPADAGGSGADPGPPRRMWRVLLIAVAVLAVAGVTYRTMTRSDDGGSPTASIPTVKPVPADFLNSIATDVDPVIENEFFRDATVTIGSHTYTRIASKLDAGCPDLTGQLKSSLDRPAAPLPAPTSSTAPASMAAAAPPATAGSPATGAPSPAPTITGPACRQLVRALYLGEPGKDGRRLLAGISVLVVDNAETAKQAAFILGVRGGGVPPLPIPAGALPGAKITGPNGDNELRTAFPDGHYAVMIQLAYSDASQAPKDDKVAADAAADLHSVTVQPLDERLLIGRGYRG
jgi:hypothetical protein